MILSKIASSVSEHSVALISLIMALTGFSYNAWRLEQSEANNNIRQASFQILVELAELELVVFYRHYSQDPTRGNPKIGWVKVGLIENLAQLMPQSVLNASIHLKSVWHTHWEELGDQGSKGVDKISLAIDQTREAVTVELKKLD